MQNLTVVMTVNILGCGIDPGVKGAIGWVAPDGIWRVETMPATNTEIWRIISTLVDTMKRGDLAVVIALEKQWHRGTSSDRLNGKNLSTFLQHYGALKAILELCGVEPLQSPTDRLLAGKAYLVEVEPRTWQSELLGATGKGETKDAAQEYVARNLSKGKVLKSQADALCLALYARQWGRMRLS